MSLTPTNNALDPPTNAAAAAAPAVAHLPSEVEARSYLYGFPSRPRLVARSNPDVWEQPTGLEAYPKPKVLYPLGADHPLCAIWEDTLGPALDTYLLGQQVQVTLINCLRIGTPAAAWHDDNDNSSSAPLLAPFVLVGVNHGTLFGQAGLDAALGCRSILVQNGIDDVHVIILESVFSLQGLYKPHVITNIPVAIVCEPFSTSLGIPISPAKYPNVEGTGGLFFIDKAKPGVLHLLTARHVLFDPDLEPNKLFTFRKNSGQPPKKVLFMGDARFDSCCNAIKSAIANQEEIIDMLKKKLEVANAMEDKEAAEMDKVRIANHTVDTNMDLAILQKLLKDVTRDWKDKKNHIIGHVTLSPPLSFNYGDNHFTDDWAVVEIYPSMVAKLNFVGNVIDLSPVGSDKLNKWMYPRQDNPTSFKYPWDDLLHFSGLVSDEDMYKPDPKTRDQNKDPIIMVMKNGNKSNLTVSRLNTIRAFVRRYYKGKPGEMSREVSVLPRDTHSGSFSKPGDSGSAVVNGTGKVCGILTGGDGNTDISDCTYVTSINFLLKRLESFGIDANIFPVAADL